MQVHAGDESRETDAFHRWQTEVDQVWRAPAAVRVVGYLDGREVVMRSGPGADPQVWSVAIGGADIDPFEVRTFSGVPLSQVQRRLQPGPIRFYGSLAEWWDAQGDTSPTLR